MKNLTNSKWLYLINILPISMIYLFFGMNYSVLRHALNAKNVWYWVVFGIVLGAFALFNLLFTLFRKRISIFYSVVSLFYPILYIYFFLNNYNQIVPKSVPSWMVSENLSICVVTFLMPTIAFSMLNLVIRFTPKASTRSIASSGLLAIAVPIFYFISAQVVLPLLHHGFRNNRVVEHVLIVLLIGATLFFFFFLVRFFYSIFMLKREGRKRASLVLKVIVAICCPVAGLLVNELPSFGVEHVGVFGNFGSWWFYFLAVVNGLFVCMPPLERKVYRLVLFLLKCLTFTYILYFFIVFLPFLPLAVLAVLAVGFGFLMLTPLALLIIQIRDLGNDFAFLKVYYPAKRLVGGALVMSLVLPAFVLNHYMNDKVVLHAALEYVYNPDFTKNYKLDVKALAGVLDVLRQHKESEDNGNFGRHQPYLSTLYNWLVLDNLTLSDKKIFHLEQIFFNQKVKKKTRASGRGRRINRNTFAEAKLINLESKSVFKDGYWSSWVDLEMKVGEITASSGVAEFLMDFSLPDGCWINDYYLDVAGKRKVGVLAEKRSAQWIYNRIKSDLVPRDPGLLKYLKGNAVRLTVFPFKPNETRKTGFQLIHRQPIRFKFGKQVVDLGNNQHPVAALKVKGAALLTAVDLVKLPKVQRQPYFHFIVDGSTPKVDGLALQKQMNKLADASGLKLADSRVTICDAFSKTFNYSENWLEEVQSNSGQGGFFLSHALKQILVRNYLDSSKFYPVIVVLSDDPSHLTLQDNFSDLKFTFPEGGAFYAYKNNALFQYDLNSFDLKRGSSCSRIALKGEVYAFPNANSLSQYLPLGVSEAVVNSKSFSVATEGLSDLEQALQLQSSFNYLQLHPNEKENHWVSMVKGSFASNVLTPFTSFMVLETEMQEAALKRKQQQVLKGKSYLDLEENIDMPEPSFWMVTVLLLLFVAWHARRSSSKRTNPK